ncbi:E3 ubiquitin-protein ligase MARCH11-like [Theropithecus gelada]|uniref:E3 ubiquitin-protein ligase MARCH11-like n=1 Tax=Theropithecus gelada TaxID=9565 RepID=UPI000DC17266|nr:E3 ubiquitin-protein ligase MARCH11-like [Theropithecus gelada]
MQAGQGRPRQDPQARKLSLSQRGEHVGAGCRGGDLRELGSPGEPPTISARSTPPPRPPGRSSRGWRLAVRWIPGPVLPSPSSFSTSFGPSHNYVHPLRLPSPRCLPQPPSPHSRSLWGGWGGSRMGRSPPPHLSPAAPD